MNAEHVACASSAAVEHWGQIDWKRCERQVGRTAAILASLTSTCRRHEVDPQLYLTQLLMNLPQAKMSELSDWLPNQWKIRHPSPGSNRNLKRSVNQ